MTVKPKKEFFNKFFIIIAIINLVVIFSLFSILSRQFVAANNQAVVTEESAVFTAEQIGAVDPFITPGPGAEDVLEKPIIDGRDPEIGPADARVTIVEFSDFSCKFCAEQDKNIKQIIEKYQGQVRLIWKDFPDMDSVSYQASLAARCAQDQGKFWEVHDLFFSEDEKILSAPLADIAAKVGLNAKVFEECVSQKKFASDIERNLKEASALRLPGVPFFFVNDQEYLGAIDKEDLELILKGTGQNEQQN